MEQEKEEFYEAVRLGYLALAEENKGRIAVIDASADIDAVEGLITAALKERFKEVFHGLC
jgi:thymidylate kinase